LGFGKLRTIDTHFRLGQRESGPKIKNSSTIVRAGLKRGDEIKGSVG
jgi:hypothetical protein